MQLAPQRDRACSWRVNGVARRSLQAHGLQDEHHNSQDDDGDDGKPGQRVPDAAVGVLAHDVFVGRDDNHKDEQNRQQNTVDDLGGHHDAKEAHARNQNNQRRNN